MRGRKFRLARRWSNRELRALGPFFEGDVINVSAGTDEDKEGGTYAEYFPGKSSYTISNYAPGSYRGFEGRSNEILLDLTKDVPDEYAHRFDVVLNHTTLEHIFPAREAFARLCGLSRDIVIIVVPFCQEQHETPGYADYWRFTPTCMRELFGENGFTVLYENANNDFNAATYLFFVGSSKPDRWEGRFPAHRPIFHAADWVGSPALTLRIPRVLVRGVRTARKWLRRS